MKNELDQFLKSKNVFDWRYEIITLHEEISGIMGEQFYHVNQQNISVMQLLVVDILTSFAIRDGKLKLEDYVKQYIPPFSFENIKLYHLLTHSSGLKAKFNKNQQISEEFLPNIEKRFEPGENVELANINFILLEFILEKVYGESLVSIANKFIFDILDMKGVEYYPIYQRKHCSDSNINHILHMILNDGFYKEKEFLDKKYIDIWFSPLFVNQEGLRSTVGWFYGKTVKSCREICGDDTVFYANSPEEFILIDRSNDIAIVFISDSILGDRESVITNQMLIEEIYQLLEKYHKI